MPVYADPVDGLAVPAKLLQAWTARLVESLGTPPDIAADVAEVLVASDRRGIRRLCEQIAQLYCLSMFQSIGRGAAT